MNLKLIGIFFSLILVASSVFAVDTASSSGMGRSCISDSDTGGAQGELGTDKQAESAGFVTLQYAFREPSQEAMSQYYVFDECSVDRKKLLERKCVDGKISTEEVSCFGSCVMTSARVFGFRGKAIFWKTKVGRCTVMKLENSMRNTYAVTWGYRQDPVTNTVIVSFKGLPTSKEVLTYLVYASNGKVINKMRVDSSSVALGEKFVLEKGKEYTLTLEFVQAEGDNKGEIVTDFVGQSPTKYTFRSIVGSRILGENSLTKVSGNTFYNTVNGHLFWKG